MLEIHRDLDEKYRALLEARRGPVFFIEHGLRQDELVEVVKDVRHHLNTHPIESGWWNSNYLPLLVAATEVGYRYRGSGTDFWPELEDEFGVQISPTDRWFIRDLFVSASKTYRGAHPPSTPWARAFHLIAWPITHALMPLEFHRPLALTLANLRVHVSELSDNELHQAIRVAASDTSARFSTLLEDAALAVAITRSLLRDDSAEICPQTAERIARDLTSDQVARRGVAVARRIQRSAKEHTAPQTPPKAPVPSITGSLQLRRHNNAMTLEAVFPQMQADLRMKLRRALRRRRYAPCLWGVSAPIPIEQLLSGVPFMVKLSAIPPKDAALLPGLDAIDIDDELRDSLYTLTLDITHPLLFAVASDKEIGYRVRGPVISGHRQYWLLTEPSESPRHFATLGEVGPYHCYHLDPTEQAAKNFLQDIGFRVRYGVSVDIAGEPPFDRYDPVPTFAVGDKRIVTPRNSPIEALNFQLGEENVSLKEDEILAVVVKTGDHILRVSNGDETREFHFRGKSSCPPVPSAACSITTRSSDLSVQALLRGTLDFAVESFAPLEGLELTAEVDANGKTYFATAPLAPLPCSVSSGEEPFRTLLDDHTRALLAQTSSLTLRLSVGRICSNSLLLEQRVRPAWWQHADDGTVTLTSEDGPLSFGRIPASAPAAPPTLGQENSLEEAQLLAPIELDASEYGGGAQFTTLCLAPSQAQLDAPAVEKPRLARLRRARHGALGLEDVVESYLRWSLAETSTLIAELRRRQVVDILDGWFTEICCGSKWRTREGSQAGIDPWEALFQLLDETGLGRDSYINLSREDEIEVTRIAVREIRLELPELWARVGPQSDLDSADYETLDLACGRAYAELADSHLKQGKSDTAEDIREGDPGAPSDEWSSVLERVMSMAEIQPLAEMLLPSDTVQELMTLEPSMMTLEELTEELSRWNRRARKSLAGSPPQSDILKTILALWIEPEIAASRDWHSALDVLLAERSVARAARYLALRCRRATKSGWG